MKTSFDLLLQAELETREAVLDRVLASQTTGVTEEQQRSDGSGNSEGNAVASAAKGGRSGADARPFALTNTSEAARSFMAQAAAFLSGSRDPTAGYRGVRVDGGSARSSGSGNGDFHHASGSSRSSATGRPGGSSAGRSDSSGCNEDSMYGDGGGDGSGHSSKDGDQGSDPGMGSGHCGSGSKSGSGGSLAGGLGSGNACAGASAVGSSGCDHSSRGSWHAAGVPIVGRYARGDYPNTGERIVELIDAVAPAPCSCLKDCSSMPCGINKQVAPT